MSMDTETLRAALWRAVGMTAADLHLGKVRTAPRTVAAETAYLMEVARRVDAMLDPAFLAAVAVLHRETTKSAD